MPRQKRLPANRRRDRARQRAGSPCSASDPRARLRSRSRRLPDHGTYPEQAHCAAPARVALGSCLDRTLSQGAAVPHLRLASHVTGPPRAGYGKT